MQGAGWVGVGVLAAAVGLVGCIGDVGSGSDFEDGSGGQGAATALGGTSAGGSSTSTAGSGMGGEAGTTATGSGTAGGGGGGVGGAGVAGGGGSIESCPASGPVTLDRWTQSPWVAPTSGTAEQVFTLSQETWLHYERLELDLDIDVTVPQAPYTCFLELRNVGGPKNDYFPWRYFAVCTKNESPKKLVHIVFAADDGYTPTPFTMKADTSYHVHVIFDAKASTTTLTLTEQGGGSSSITKSPLTSSIVPQGQGLRLLVGFNVNHPDYPAIKPPWGWSFRNLHVNMQPGGPYGSLAPACP